VATLALIINTHQQPEYLRRVLKGVARQTSLPDEVLVADDGSGPETREMFDRWSGEQKMKTFHVWQEHEGFRRARILNEAIATARCDYIVFLDGDTLPHPRFMADHRACARTGCFIQGHRTLVRQKGAAWFGSGTFSKDRTRALFSGQMSLKHAFRWPVRLLRFRDDFRGIRGCNLGIWRHDLIRINGYNEAFVGWGREDSELAVRLMNLGVRRLDLRGRALCYHLWHPPAERDGLSKNDDLLAETQAKKSTYAENGLAQHLQLRERGLSQ
jgi:glycosyltransferase involved in cell wall biosynthesis